ncbi:MAG: ABC transporter ATP-binding protein [Patescibacteria group bacterium]
MALLEVQNLSKTYRDEETETLALKNVNLSIEEGEFVAIMGPSGSGKSTLLHILGLLDEPTSGTYRFKNRDTREYSRTDLARIRNREIGFVFQAFNLLAKSTTLDNVLLPLYYSEVNDSLWQERAEKSIASVELSHRMHYKTSKLSGGEKQRVAIARALVNNPPIIFADEPTGNLDSRSGQAVMEIIQRLNEEKGHTVILITHEFYTAEHAQRIIKIRDGEIASDEKVAHRQRATAFKK